MQTRGKISGRNDYFYLMKIVILETMLFVIHNIQQYATSLTTNSTYIHSKFAPRCHEYRNKKQDICRLCIPHVSNSSHSPSVSLVEHYRRHTDPHKTVIIFLPTGLPYYPSQAFVHDNPKIVSPHFLRSPGERTLLHPLLR